MAHSSAAAATRGARESGRGWVGPGRHGALGIKIGGHANEGPPRNGGGDRRGSRGGPMVRRTLHSQIGTSRVVWGVSFGYSGYLMVL